MATTFPKQEGDIDPSTGRIAVRVDVFARSEINGDAPAYLFKQKAEEWGMDPWRLIDGVDQDRSGENFDIWGAADWWKRVGPSYLIFVAQKDAARL